MPNNPKYPHVTVLLLAGGKGTRMQSDTPKQYMDLGGLKVIEYSILKFRKLIDKLVIIVPNVDEASFLKEKYPEVTLASALDTRAHSLAKELESVTTDFVLIHDASRPFVTSKVFDSVVSALKEYDCAYPVVPLSSSIVLDRNGHLQEAPDRSVYREVQTPQGFHTKTLQEALGKFGDKHIHIPELIRLLGKEVKHVEGSPWLFKITYAPDIHAAEYYVNHYKLKE